MKEQTRDTEIQINDQKQYYIQGATDTNAYKQCWKEPGELPISPAIPSFTHQLDLADSQGPWRMSIIKT